MRKTILTRSVIAAATLAIGSVALAATPATAASAQGVTRDEVLTAVNGVRAADANDTSYSFATGKALRALVTKACGVSTNPADNEYANLEEEQIRTTNAGDDAEGLLISAEVYVSGFGGEDCTFAAFATADPTFQLAGTATISGTRFNETTDADESVTLRSQALSGDAFVTSPLNGQSLNDVDNLVAAAVGNATKTTVTKTTTKVADKKTKSEKKKAKATYAKKIKSVKKSYAKALDKAGKSKSKKAAAKKAYKAKRATAKAKYTYAIASYKLVKKSSSSTENRPFSITTPVSVPEVVEVQ